MRIRNPKEINEVQYPEVFLPALKDANSLLVESVQRDGLPIDSGIFDIGIIDKPVDTALFFIRWIGATNEIINYLNILIADMRELPSMFPVLAGSPRDRFYLLVATYFHEFYRFRETHNQVVKAAAHRGFIKHEDIKVFRQRFHDAFAPTIELRNSLVHGAPVWTGKRHFDLIFLNLALECGYEMRDKETGKVWDIRSVLSEICFHTADVFRDEGNRMAAVQKSLVECYVDAAQRTAKQPV